MGTTKPTVKRPKPVRIFRLECNPKTVFTGHHMYTFEFDEPVIDAWLVPEEGGEMFRMDYRGADDGVIKIKFQSPRTRLRAIMYSVPA